MLQKTAVIALAVASLVGWAASAQDQGPASKTRAADSLAPVSIDVSAAKAAMLESAARRDGIDLVVRPGLQMVAQRQRATNLLETLTAEERKQKGLNDPATVAAYVVGDVDTAVYWFIEIPFPPQLKDLDGGTIRLIMQHEIAGDDQLRVIDEHIATEADHDFWGRRGRGFGRYGWTRQSGGGDLAWILGDGVQHNLANPWDWAWIVDYRWLQDNTVLPLDVIRIYTHPHVTTRVIIKD